jgi:hypothetical protein
VTLSLSSALPHFAASAGQPRFFGAKSHADDAMMNKQTAVSLRKPFGPQNMPMAVLWVSRR